MGHGGVCAGALDRVGRSARRWTLSSRPIRSAIAEDLDGDVVFLARNQFYLDYTREQAPGIAFTDVKDIHKLSPMA